MELTKLKMPLNNIRDILSLMGIQLFCSVHDFFVTLTKTTLTNVEL